MCSLFSEGETTQSSLFNVSFKLVVDHPPVGVGWGHHRSFSPDLGDCTNFRCPTQGHITRQNPSHRPTLGTSPFWFFHKFSPLQAN